MYYIGSLWGSTDPFFLNGVIDDVRVYERAMSDGEIWQIYQESLK
jgi:hypothetical protein